MGGVGGGWVCVCVYGRGGWWWWVGGNGEEEGRGGEEGEGRGEEQWVGGWVGREGGTRVKHPLMEAMKIRRNPPIPGLKEKR